MRRIKVTGLSGHKWGQTERGDFHGEVFDNWKQSCIDKNKWGLQAGTYPLIFGDDGTGEKIRIQAAGKTWEIPQSLVESVQDEPDEMGGTTKTATIRATYTIEEIDLDFDAAWLKRYKRQLVITAKKKRDDWLANPANSDFDADDIALGLLYSNDPAAVGLPAAVVAAARNQLKSAVTTYFKIRTELKAATTKAELDAIRDQYSL